MLAPIESDTSIRGAKVLGYYSATQEPDRDDLALARARELAVLLRQRTGLPVVAEAFGAAPSTTYPEPCVRAGSPEDRRGAERFATFGVLRCAEARPSSAAR
ncbi:MAG TPA: hypothetical protein RMH99_00415 [Sandaracinaceae bacterium LLY-WYZ-13_1]|nr:hypothetical protein [Sandaracinaceae bacterium LLY-WYZ-13_1]